MPVTGTQRVVVGIKVHFTLNTTDGLRRVIFGLTKDTEGEEIKWTIKFTLFERANKTDDFGDAIVDVDVEVDTKLNDAAEATAGKKRMTPAQTNHALGPAANDAKKAKNGQIPQDKAETTIQNTLKK